MRKMLAVIICLISSQAVAGNVMEMLTRDMNGTELDRMTFFTDVTRSRMDQTGVNGSLSVIFLDNEFIYLDHAQKQYMVMDEAMLEGIGSQVNEAMKQMEAELAKLPPEQRAMVEQMMNEGMGSAGMTMDAPVLEVRKVGKGKWNSYDCTMVEMLEGGVKIQEICSVDYSEVDGSGAVRDSFMQMAALLSKLYNALPFGDMGTSNPMEMLDDLEGFPVRAVEIENGRPVRETILESTMEKSIDASMFSLPPDYSRINPFAP